jgi:uncharacterized membrane protein
LHALLENWPSYLAYAVSFLYIGVLWLNHHSLFSKLRRVNLGFRWINLGILFTTAVLPFPTAVLASALAPGNSSYDQRVAVTVYALEAAAGWCFSAFGRAWWPGCRAGWAGFHGPWWFPFWA